MTAPVAARAAADAGTGAAPSTVRAEVVVGRVLMGGRVAIALRGDRPAAVLETEATRILDRIEAWASRLTRFDAGSDLSLLNASPDAEPAIGPTLTAVLDWARQAEALTDGLVDVSLLDARLAAEHGSGAGAIDNRRPAEPRPTVRAGRRWSLSRTARGATVVRGPGVRFDLDGVAKGWLADRALALAGARSAVVDADGDIALRVAPGEEWTIGVADPRDGSRLAVLRLAADIATGGTLGVATSGTSVHRWVHGTTVAHHLIDPRTGRPATTDVVQATVIAASARVAESHAKTAVVAGSDEAFRRLDRPDVLGLILLTERGELRATREATRWLA